ncbi:MAG: hypothetical protein ACI4SS_02485 [Clostridia bacterium]
MIKNGKSKQGIAIILCCVFLAAFVGLSVVDKMRSARDYEIYKTVMADQERKALEREQEQLNREAQLERARENLAEAAQTYLPGIVFYGDSLTQGVGGNGVSYPSILYSLIKNNIYDVKTGFVNVLSPVERADYKAWLPIVFIGTDSGWNGDIQNLIDSQKKYINGRERYIVIGIPTGTRDERAALEAAMEAEYGDRYINLREYLSTNGLSSLELEIHPEDKAAMEKGSVPPSLMNSDMLHLNDNGYKLVAFLVYDRMTSLGYFDEVKDAARIVTDIDTESGGAEAQ